MKVAVVGLGAISSLHINALIKNNQSIVAFCDIDIEKCKASSKQFGLDVKAYSSYDKMLEDEKIDSVHICTPHYLHAEMICKAIKRGINVLCEKPLAISKEQLKSIEVAIKNSNAYLGVCQQNRYNDAIKVIKKHLENKKVISAYGNLVWERNAEYYLKDSWRGKWSSEGGGVMINQALHTLDILQWICGMPSTVKAHISNNSLSNVIEVEDTAYGLFSINDGSNFIINATNSAKKCFKISMAFYCEDVLIEVIGDTVFINNAFVSKFDNKPAYGKEVWGRGHIDLVDDFYNCIKNKQRFHLDFYEGRKVVDLILAMYKSNGEVIQIE